MTTKVVRDIIKIDEERCDGCGACVLSCAEGALQIVDGKAKLISLKDNRKEFMPMIKKFGLSAMIEKLAKERVQGGTLAKADRKEWIEKTFGRFTLIRIDPDEITFLRIDPKKGMERNIWEKRARS